MAKFAVLGSSYVARLRDFCNSDLKLPGECRFFGKGGMKTDSVPDHMMTELQAFKPDVLIHLGSNDIQRDSRPKKIFDNLCEIEDTLATIGATVYIAEVCRRGDFTKAPGLTEESFNKQRNSINRLLLSKFGKRVVRFPVQYPSNYDKRLVHFSEVGIRKYFFTVRRVFLKC